MHTCFIDLRKVYETVNRSDLWGVLQHIGISLKLQRLIKDLHTGTRSRVCAYGKTSDYFDVNKGVRQGCIIVPALVNLFLDHVLRIALKACTDGVKVRYTVNGEIRVRTFAEEGEIQELSLSLLYADDMAIVCEDVRTLERIVTGLDEVMFVWGLEVSSEKTEVLSVDRFSSTTPPDISLRGHRLKNVFKFNHRGPFFRSPI